MKLTIQQRGYMTERLSALAKRRIDKEVASKLGVRPEIPKLNFLNKCELIRSGKAKMKPQEQIHSYTDLTDAYTYPENGAAKAQKLVEAYEAKAEAIACKVHDEKQRIVDMLMLGESAAALAALEAFEQSAN